MALESLDFLSPKITIYYYGRKIHSSMAGGILTIIMFLSCISYIIHISSELILHCSPNCQYYRKYLQDAGYYPFDNKEGIFHFFQLYSLENENLIGNFNKKYIRIIMTRYYDISQITPDKLSKSDHWVYDFCRIKDAAKKYDNIFSNNINNSICLRYYYNSTLKKYYTSDDEKNFIYPYLIYGGSNNNNLFLTTIVEKCRNDSVTIKIQGNCATDEEINEYLKINFGIRLLFLNHQVDTYNYKNPDNVFISQIINDLDSDNIPTNNVHFSPLIIKTNDGLITKSTKTETTYIYEENKESITRNLAYEKILSIYFYWLQNNAQIYERKYKNLADDILPNIGGIIQLIYYCFCFINKIFNKLKVIRDSRNLIFKWNQTYNEVHNDQNKFLKVVNSLQKLSSLKKNRNTELKKNRKFCYSIFKNLSNEVELNQSCPHNTVIFKGKIINHKSDKVQLSTLKKKEKNAVNESYQSLVILKPSKMSEVNSLNRKKYNSLFSQKINGDITFHPKKIQQKSELLLNKYKNIDVKCIGLKNKLSQYNFELENKLKENKVDKCDLENYSKIIDSVLNNGIKNNLNEVNKASKNSLSRKSFKISTFNHHLTYNEYISSILCCFRQKKNVVYVLEKFRKKLLSEEHFFRTNLFLCLAEKKVELNNIGNVDLIQLYQNL